MSSSTRGGCRCGAVRYECRAEPVGAVSCSCEDCKIFYGGVMAAAVILPRAAVTISGDPVYFEVVGGSGKSVARGFCANCGTQLFGKPDIAPQLMSVTAGSLDHHQDFKPQMHVYNGNAYPWLHLAEDITRFEAMPDRIPEI